MENTAYKESSAPPSQVDELVAAIRPIRRRPDGYRAIHVHFSLLDRQHKQPYHRRSIATAFNKLVNKGQGQLFWISNFDLVFLCKDCTITEMDDALLVARRAVENSPVIKEYIEAGRDDDLCDWYDLSEDMDSFTETVERLNNPYTLPKPATPTLHSMITELSDELADSNDIIAADPQPKPVTRPIYNPVETKNDIMPMGPIQLDQLERNLINIEMDRMLKKQTAYVIVGNSRPQPIFDEHFVSVPDIKHNLLPKYDMFADKWLFQRLTRTFDTKLLQNLPNKHLDPHQVISININVETIFSHTFDKFITKFKHKNNQPLILEMKLFDVISDIQRYNEARDKLEKLGCRISLDAMDVLSLSVMDRTLLAVDFLKISWKKDYTKMLGTPMEDKITTAIRDLGAMRIILCHCDNEPSLEFGRRVGIHMYQGFLIDKKCAP